jgi:predicted transcriptional regulator
VVYRLLLDHLRARHSFLFHQSTNQALLGKFVIKTIKQGNAQQTFFQKYQSGGHVKLKINILFFLTSNLVTFFRTKQLDENAPKRWLISGYGRDLDG